MGSDLHSASSDETWQRARSYHLALGPIPSLFSACVRTINKVEAVLDPIDNESVREMAISSAAFLVKVSPTLRAIFYFAAERLYPDKLAATPELTVKALLAVFTPREVASILGLTFLYRRAAKKCDPQEWPLLSRKIQIQMEIGYQVGRRMELLGSGNGLLLGGIRFLAVSTFAIEAHVAYKDYRRGMRKPHTLFDMELEQKLFGCNHLHVASLIVQALGFCMPRSNISMSLGMDALSVKGSVLPRKLATHVASWKGAMHAIEHMHRTGAFVAEGEDYQLKLPPEEVVVIESEIVKAVRTPTFDWIAKSIKDLPPEVCAVLLGGSDEEEELD